MTKIIQQPKIKKLEKLIFNPMVQHQTSFHPEVLRIQNEAEFTRIDFICYPDRIYVNGGWVQISRESFIRTAGSKERLKLVNAINIPIAPVKHYFKSIKDSLCYTLYFPPVPKGTTTIDIIECEAPGGTWFNFYSVSMERIKQKKLVVGN